jgi:hypothetical protein
VVSVPYAGRAGAAEFATNLNGGTVNATSISVSGTPVIDSNGALVGNTAYAGVNGVSITGRNIGLVPGCQGGETLRWSGAPSNVWQCAAAAPAAGDGGVVAYTADPDGGLQLVGTNFTAFSLLRSCAINQVLKWNGSAWGCANDADVDTTYGVAAGQGLAASGTGNTLFGMASCSAGQIMRSGGGTWACGSDTDTIYTATVNKGLLLSGTGFAIDACPNGQFMKSTGGGNYACASDTDTLFDVISGAGLLRTGNNFGLQACPSGQVLKSNGSGTWACQVDENSGGTVTQIQATNGLTLCPRGCATSTARRWRGCSCCRRTSGRSR